MLPLGDRVLLFWAEERAGKFDIFSQTLSAQLTELTPPEQVTSGSGDAVGPAPAFGPDGDVGFVYNDRSSGSWQVSFQRLICR
jgi:hypothetical protein